MLFLGSFQRKAKLFENRILVRCKNEQRCANGMAVMHIK
ncbi:hypothetical protein GOB13_19025 [Sinorhizobium meliloti]|nr:hypothetical protein [Sinorhizobium meliloti]MDX0083398.1 hypothetical protein [Sinorhizobium meliloti]